MTDRTHMRGFASMSKEDRHRIASSGGKAAHASGTAHRFTPEEARAAGKKSRANIHQIRRAKIA